MKFDYYDFVPILNKGIQMGLVDKGFTDDAIKLTLNLCVKDTYNPYSALPIDQDVIWCGVDISEDIYLECNRILSNIDKDKKYRKDVYTYILDAIIDRIEVYNDVFVENADNIKRMKELVENL